MIGRYLDGATMTVMVTEGIAAGGLGSCWIGTPLRRDHYCLGDGGAGELERQWEVEEAVQPGRSLCLSMKKLTV